MDRAARLFLKTWFKSPLGVAAWAPSSDALGRIVATHLGRRLGQPVVVENRAGAGGTTGVLQVAQGAADGYTIVQGAVGNIAFLSSEIV